jgi:sugar/nucleoside kinase (ribokinase family)
VILYAPFGRDEFGRYLLDRLRSAGVDTSAAEFTEARTATSVVLVNAAGERALLHRRGASGEGFGGPLEYPGPGRIAVSHLHLGTPFAVPKLRPRAAELLAGARRRGWSTSVDTQWDAAGRWMEDLGPALPFTDILFANRDEARMLTGETDPARAAARFRARGARDVVVKLGGEGCAVFAGEEEFRVPAFPTEVVDTTGAGDCFVGGFLAARQRGAGFRDAARYASAVAALSIRALGAVDGLLSHAETAAWMEAAG